MHLCPTTPCSGAALHYWMVTGYVGFGVYVMRQVPCKYMSSHFTCAPACSFFRLPTIFHLRVPTDCVKFFAGSKLVNDLYPWPRRSMTYFMSVKDQSLCLGQHMQRHECHSHLWDKVFLALLLAASATSSRQNNSWLLLCFSLRLRLFFAMVWTLAKMAWNLNLKERG